MARRPRVLFEGAIYHVTFRGNNKQDIFTDVRDRKKLLEKLAEYRETYRVKIYLYCLMTNHVHILVETPFANLDKFMGALLTGYTVFYNRRHNRSGHLMQGRYGSQLVSGDEYLLKLSRYIHLNPVHTDYWDTQTIEEKAAFLQKYAWSSYRTYIGLNHVNLDWLDINPLMALLPPITGSNPHETYRRYIESGLINPDNAFREQLKENPLAVGSEEYVNKIKGFFGEIAEVRVRAEDVLLRANTHRRPMNEILDAVKSITGADDVFLTRRIHAGRERAFLAKAWLKYSGETQRNIATRLGLTTGAAVSALVKKHTQSQAVNAWLTMLDLIFKG